MRRCAAQISSSRTCRLDQSSVVPSPVRNFKSFSYHQSILCYRNTSQRFACSSLATQLTYRDRCLLELQSALSLLRCFALRCSQRRPHPPPVGINRFATILLPAVACRGIRVSKGGALQVRGGPFDCGSVTSDCDSQSGYI